MPVSRQKAEDPSEIGASPPLNGHTLEHTLRRHKKYHKVCALNRKNGTSFEINRERQRTEMLNRKYFDNLRQQQQALSGRIEEPRAREQNGTTPFEADASVFVSHCVYTYVCVHVRTCTYVCVCVCTSAIESAVFASLFVWWLVIY